MPQVLRGVSLMICMVPVNNIALGTLPPDRLKNASGLYNLTRNLGGAVGLAVINTVLNDRWTCTSSACDESVELGPRDGRRTAREHDRRTSQSLGSDARGAALKVAVEHGPQGGAGDVLRRRFPDPDAASSSRSRSQLPLVRKPKAVGGGGGH